MTDGALDQIDVSALFRFADWLSAVVPKFGTGVYTIWDSSGEVSAVKEPDVQ